MIRRPPRSTRKESSAASDVYKRQMQVQVLVQVPKPLLLPEMVLLVELVPVSEQVPVSMPDPPVDQTDPLMRSVPNPQLDQTELLPLSVLEQLPVLDLCGTAAIVSSLL